MSLHPWIHIPSFPAIRKLQVNNVCTISGFSVCFAGQDLLPHHSHSNGAEMTGSIRLASPLNSQSASATLTISNDHLLPQSPANTGMAG